eukprot:293662_1
MTEEIFNTNAVMSHRLWTDFDNDIVHNNIEDTLMIRSNIKPELFSNTPYDIHTTKYKIKDDEIVMIFKLRLEPNKHCRRHERQWMYFYCHWNMLKFQNGNRNIYQNKQSNEISLRFYPHMCLLKSLRNIKCTFVIDENLQFIVITIPDKNIFEFVTIVCLDSYLNSNQTFDLSINKMHQYNDILVDMKYEFCCTKNNKLAFITTTNNFVHFYVLSYQFNKIIDKIESQIEVAQHFNCRYVDNVIINENYVKFDYSQTQWIFDRKSKELSKLEICKKQSVYGLHLKKLSSLSSSKMYLAKFEKKNNSIIVEKDNYIIHQWKLHLSNVTMNDYKIVWYNDTILIFLDYDNEYLHIFKHAIINKTKQCIINKYIDVKYLTNLILYFVGFEHYGSWFTNVQQMSIYSVVPDECSNDETSSDNEDDSEDELTSNDSDSAQFAEDISAYIMLSAVDNSNIIHDAAEIPLSERTMISTYFNEDKEYVIISAERGSLQSPVILHNFINISAKYNSWSHIDIVQYIQ